MRWFIDCAMVVLWLCYFGEVRWCCDGLSRYAGEIKYGSLCRYNMMRFIDIKLLTGNMVG